MESYSFYTLKALYKEYGHKKPKLNKLLSSFKSRSDDVNDYLTNRALIDELNKISKTFLILNSKKNKILFYFTIMPKSMSTIGLPIQVRIKFLKDDRISSIHTTLLAQLGKSEDWKNLPTNYIWDYIYQEIENLEFAPKFILIDCSKCLKKYYESLGFIYLYYDNLNKLYTLIKPLLF